MKWLAPAKINLSLRVLGRREDGFHEIETLMVPITLADEVTLEPVEDTAVLSNSCAMIRPYPPAAATSPIARRNSFRDRTGLPDRAVAVDG